MKIVIQRVLNASVTIEGKVEGSINDGMVILVGIEQEDTTEDIDWLTNKLANLRIFDDEAGVMNLNVNQVEGEILVISQFTLQASTKKGNRPSYIKAAKPEISIPLYEQLIITLDRVINTNIATGKFGADMQVSLINDGPVTIIIDSKNRV
ncbi:MAG: D-aminoacyl-tRNA deacylase [Cyclobacteriaceae bacterium]|nr:D-aminoacyl-tRNA deacylase [Cyclobacteriaceae bacterium]